MGFTHRKRCLVFLNVWDLLVLGFARRILVSKILVLRLSCAVDSCRGFWCQTFYSLVSRAKASAAWILVPRILLLRFSCQWSFAVVSRVNDSGAKHCDLWFLVPRILLFGFSCSEFWLFGFSWQGRWTLLSEFPFQWFYSIKDPVSQLLRCLSTKTITFLRLPLRIQNIMGNYSNKTSHKILLWEPMFWEVLGPIPT